MFVFVQSRSLHNYIWISLSCYIFNYFPTSTSEDIMQNLQNGLSFKRRSHLPHHYSRLFPVTKRRWTTNKRVILIHDVLFLATCNILLTRDSDFSYLNVNLICNDSQKWGSAKWHIANSVSKGQNILLHFHLVYIKCHYVIAKTLFMMTAHSISTAHQS